MKVFSYVIRWGGDQGLFQSLLQRIGATFEDLLSHTKAWRLGWGPLQGSPTLRREMAEIFMEKE